MITFKQFLAEGMMKRSDPWISGERAGPRPSPKTDSPHAVKMKKYAALTGKDLGFVEEKWRAAKEKTDPRLEKRWALVQQEFKVMLGL